jgi:hypothetical protein
VAALRAAAAHALAVHTVQRVGRGYLARQQVRTMRAQAAFTAAVDTVQRVGRGFLARRVAASLRFARKCEQERVAAVHLQRLTRGHRTRRADAAARVRGKREAGEQTRRLPWELAEVCVCAAGQLAGVGVGAGPRGAQRGTGGLLDAQAAIGALVRSGVAVQGRVYTK